MESLGNDSVLEQDWMLQSACVAEILLLYWQAAAKCLFQYLTWRFVKIGQKCVLLFWRPYCFFSKMPEMDSSRGKTIKDLLF